LDDNEVWMLHGEEYTLSGDRSSGLFAPGSLWLEGYRAFLHDGRPHPRRGERQGRRRQRGINACVRQAGQRIDGAEGHCWRACV
jgi:hypothetical protein